MTQAADLKRRAYLSTDLTMSSRMDSLAKACICGLHVLVVLLTGSINSVRGREHKSFEHAQVTPSRTQGYEFQMMHKDFQDLASRFSSSYSSPHLSSLRERYTNAAKRSRDRANSMKQLGKSRSSQASGAVSPVFSQLGEYLVYISIGTPARTFTTIVDTGSDLVWVQCKPCPDCFQQPDPFFDPRKSSTYRKVNCTSALCANLQLATCKRNVCSYSYGYGDGSFTDGNLSLETATLSTTDGSTELVPDFAFGCGTDDEGDFSGSDGIVGLGQGSLSMMTQLAPALGDKFSYCLVSFTDAPTKTSPLILGDAQPSAAGISWTPLIRNIYAQSFYYVGIEDMSVGGQRLNIPKSAFEIDQYGDGGTILDSGTTLYFLESEAYVPLESRLKQLINYPLIDASATGLELCYNLSDLKRPAVFPTITIHFTDADFHVPQDNAFVLIDEQGTTCLTAIPTLGFSIVGNLLQQNFLFIFDREKGRLGFSPQQCG